MKTILLKNNSLIDVHTHGMGIMLTHMLSGHYPFSQDIIDLSNKTRDGGVDYVIVFPMPTSIYYDVLEIKRHRYRRAGNCDYPFQYENYALVNLVKDFSLKNVLPFLSFSTHSQITKQKESIIEIIQSYDVYGLKYHATIERRSVLTKQFEEFAEIARLYDIPIMVHTKIDKWANPNYLIDFATQNPDVRICAAHCAHFDAEFFRRVKKECPSNLFVDCSPFTRICYDYAHMANHNILKLNFLNPQDAFKQLFEEIPTMLLWGTDTPFNVFCDESRVTTYRDEVEIISSELQREQLYRNTLRFLFGTKSKSL